MRIFTSLLSILWKKIAASLWRMYKPFSPHKNASMIVKCMEWKIPKSIFDGKITTKRSNTNKPWKHEKISFHATKFEQKIQQKLRIAVIKTQLLLVKQRYQCTNTLKNTKDSYFMSIELKKLFLWIQEKYFQIKR